ncbi:MAG: outer membrane beta-barrel protein [Fermentimonas sp.]
MKKKIVFVALFASLFTIGKSQLKDVTFTLSPMIEHTWWNDHLTIDNSTFWGGRVGFGFGPMFEVRGFYQRSFDVQATLRSLDWKVTDDWGDKMVGSNVEMERYGGELKLNLVKNRIFSPFITVGGGVHRFTYYLPSLNNPQNLLSVKEGQLFGALGLGTKFRLSDRLEFTLEAKNNALNVSDQSYYLSPEYVLNDDRSNWLHNWAAVASLDIFLGGMKVDEDELSRAYARLFSDGFSGMKFVLEPGGVYVDFHENSLLSDQYFLGGSAGVDFSSLVGLRGFYYRATQDPAKPSLNFNDNLAMYGGNLIARLNQPRGVTPYLTLGAGYMKVKEGYVGSDGLAKPKSSPFAVGGVGLEIPLSRYIALHGAMNALFSPEERSDGSNVLKPSQVKTSLMYQAGLRFNLGKAAHVDADFVYRDATRRAVQEEREYSNEQINQLRVTYQEQIAMLNAELDSVTQAQDYTRAAEIMQEREAVGSSLQDLDASLADRGTLVRMTEDDLNRLVNDVISETRRGAYEYYTTQTAVEPSKELTDRLDDLERKLDRNFVQMSQADQATAPSTTTVISDRTTATRDIAPRSGAVSPVKTDGRFFKWNRLSVFTGLGFGDMTAWNVGARGYLQIGDTELDFVPEFYVGMGDKNGLGLSGNVVYNFLKPDSFLRPYAGLGLGIFHGKNVHYGTNVIIGADIQFLGGNLFADYSCRKWFKQNQLAVGYRFVF